MRYKCLVLDHDDTAVKSTQELHYPAFRRIMEKMRPEYPQYSLEEFTKLCFYPGFTEYCRTALGFDDNEIMQEYTMWKDYIKDKVPSFYDGFMESLVNFKEKGGIVCVVSLSEKDDILKHYETKGFVPDEVYGWELPEELRKPNPYPLQQIIKRFELKPKDVLVLDDMRLGGDMAKACGVDFAACGWADVMLPEVEEYLRKHSEYYFESVEEFGSFIIGE